MTWIVSTRPAIVRLMNNERSSDHASWAESWTDTIRRQVIALRRREGLSAQALADRCAEYNVPMSRGTIAKLENGDRKLVGVHEIVVLAAALGVAPMDLLFPGVADTDPDTAEQTVEYFPGEPIPARTAWYRFAGERPHMVRVKQARYMTEQTTRLLRQIEEG
ncbi:MAG: helix-turn-helix transcriptional regulator [Mobilicoccus sp.]|nr:helix-turn-helix transcriptional regulator [Mobilicoccus sp.]